MAQPILVPFVKGIATVQPSGVVDIRLVDDVNHITLTGRMTVEEVARIAEHVHNAAVPGLVVISDEKPEGA